MRSVSDQGIYDAAEDVEQLLRSRTRIRILSELYQHTQCDRDQLREATDVSRTTLRRNLDSLIEQGWIKNSGVIYQITPCGELVCEEVLDLLKATRTAKRLQKVFQWISVSELDINLRLLAEGEVLTPERGDPYAMINRHVQVLKGAEQIRGLLSVTGLHAHEAAHSAIVDCGAHGELIVLPTVAETHLSKPKYSELTEEMLETGRFNVYVYDDDVPFSLVVLDETVQIAVDEDGEPRALLEIETEPVRAWATRTLDSYKAQATPITEFSL